MAGRPSWSTVTYEEIDTFLVRRPPAFTGKVSEDLPDLFPYREQPEFG